MKRCLADLAADYPDGRGAFKVTRVEGSRVLLKPLKKKAEWVKRSDIPAAWKATLFHQVLHDTNEEVDILKVGFNATGVPSYTVGVGEPVWAKRVLKLEEIPRILHEDVALKRLSDMEKFDPRVELLRVTIFVEEDWTDVENVQTEMEFHVRFNDDGLYVKVNEKDSPEWLCAMGTEWRTMQRNAVDVPPWHH